MDKNYIFPAFLTVPLIVVGFPSTSSTFGSEITNVSPMKAGTYTPCTSDHRLDSYEMPNMPTLTDYDNFQRVLGFAEKFVSQIEPVDHEIQNYVNEHFWDLYDL